MIKTLPRNTFSGHPSIADLKEKVSRLPGILTMVFPIGFSYSLSGITTIQPSFSHHGFSCGTIGFSPKKIIPKKTFLMVFLYIYDGFPYGFMVFPLGYGWPLSRCVLRGPGPLRIDFVLRRLRVLRGPRRLVPAARGGALGRRRAPRSWRLDPGLDLGKKGRNPMGFPWDFPW